MSTKKDKKSLLDSKFMKVALDLARARIGLTGENPSVGCVIVKNNKILSIGQTGFNGRPHAEYNAIKNCHENLNGSKMYLTLEPCNHYGKTPPCTKTIIRSGIKEIFYAIEDIDKRVKGKSFKILSKNNIKVHRGLKKKEARDLYNYYFINRINKIPYVTGKIAVSNNKLIFSKNKKRITDKISDKLTHYLRYKNDAILISSKTLNIDNPNLNCRIKGLEKFSPKRVILDRNLNINENSYIYKSAKKSNTIIIHNSNNKLKKVKLIKKNIILIKSEISKNKLFDLKKILKKLYSLGIRTLLVEGGDIITKTFLRKKLFDEFYFFKSTKNLPKIRNFKIFTSFNFLKNKYYKNKKRYKLAQDYITIYKR